MITVNIWLSTTQLFNKRITHRYFGPLLASQDNNEHIGHVNIQLEITENSMHFAYSQTALEPLKGKATLKTIAVPVDEKKESHASHKPQWVRCNSFTLSFWPEDRPKLLKEAAHLFFKLTDSKPRVKGVKPEFKTHAEDMLLEETAPQPVTIKHPTLHYRKDNAISLQLQKLKRELIEFADLHAMLPLSQFKLEENREQQKKLLQQKQALDLSHTQKMQQLQYELQKNRKAQQKTQTQLTRKKTVHRYLSRLEQRDDQSNAQFLALTKEINKLTKQQQRLVHEEEGLLRTQKKLEKHYHRDNQSLDEQLVQRQQEEQEWRGQLDGATLRLNGRDEEEMKILRAQYIDLSLRENAFLAAESQVTTGRHPDMTLYLPAADSVTIGLDEKKIMQAMAEEKDQTYSFIVNNCASSVKRCLLAGIDNALKKQLQDQGLEPDFFKVKKIETCQSLKKWTKTLEHHLIMLNAAAHRSETTPSMNL
ncbi:hypothetical protein DIZ81_06465 [Legionella taurinensis]|uniref:Uncharacterized protein n=1 Tax=Legionella taurinensis TaxID=70611 RepID=A0A3A5LB33_9GAMM|nr:hypothetical protein [Legionella taurinensis]MDX1837566.1 hypothetical protein [Legionella taurinensis]PUT40898.1 hypothetical protein DB744_06465 [Legionella taurinensis]PUT41653.1 hypothetical protein DB743_13620 [Legionella taurinensis]PUT44320.1 hypothetical protein DB746_04865 [Legionella taurinensis]PUT48761.1 hypothetical protein DB745_04865 [Legionella taurinensis]